MLNALDQTLIFLLQILFNLFIFILLLRGLMQWAGVHFYNPLAQFSIKLTNWLVKPLRLFLPNLYGIDLSILIGAMLTIMIKWMLLIILSGNNAFNILILQYAVIDIISSLLNIWFFAIIFRVIMSWIAPFMFNPIGEVIFLITEPLLAPARRIIPPLSGFDFSPILILILIKVIDIFLNNLLPL